ACLRRTAGLGPEHGRYRPCGTEVIETRAFRRWGQYGPVPVTTSTTSAPPSNATKKPKIRAPRVFWPAAIIIGLAVLLTAVFPAGADTVLQTLQSGVVSGFAPYFVLLGTGFVIFCLAMGLSRFGDIKL